ncbi:MAG: beta-ketoacyl-ACP synthase III [Erysipelotrichaceae bacterium]|jgi:3-oxoacyl-[acyl-carrier-protein] synthase-3
MKILGYGKSLPNKIVSNDDLSKLVETSDEWIIQRTGIRNRRISDVNTSVLASQAALEAINDAQIDKDDIDLIICATMTADNATPSVACLVQKELGLENATAFDINGACTGFIYALKVVEGLLKLNHKKALVIGSEVMSKVIDFTDRNTCILFGDGAGAVVVEKGEDAYFFTKSKGNFDVLYAEGTSLNTDLDVKEITGGFLYMDGREVFKFAIRAMEEAILKVLEEANLTIDDIDMIIPHQANQRIISNVAKRMKIDESKFFMNLEEYGNTSAASVAIALTEAKKQNVIKEKDKVILVGFGAGLTWGSTLIEI